MARKALIAGNWKMNGTLAEATALAEGVANNVTAETPAEVLLCPPFTALGTVAQAIDGSAVQLGAQNVYPEAGGAFTGEISSDMLKDFNVSYVIVGHSERREVIGESDNFLNKKVKYVLENNLKVILCVGESLETREAGETLRFVQAQLEVDLQDVSAAQVQTQLVIAYEPIWAIGTGKTATTEQAQEVHAFIRQWLTEHYGEEVAQAVRIQYGGSVKPDNAKDLLSQPDIDGALVGGASLKVDDFSAIIEAAQPLEESCSTD